MIVGVTGHQNIPRNAIKYIRRGLAQVLSRYAGDLTGVTSLAAGADQLFAQEILNIKGQLHVVIPSKHYEDTFDSKRIRSSFLKLKNYAAHVETLDYPQPSEDAFLEAGRRIVDLSSIMIAVWDGLEARGKGGTADIVAYARESDIDIIIVWPPGMSR